MSDTTLALSNGDGLCYSDLQKELVGMAINRAEAINAAKGKWRVFPKDPVDGLKDLRKGVEVNRNRDVNWTRVLEKKSSDWRIGVWARLAEIPGGIALTVTDEDFFSATLQTSLALKPAQNEVVALETLRDNISKMLPPFFTRRICNWTSAKLGLIRLWC